MSIKLSLGAVAPRWLRIAPVAGIVVAMGTSAMAERMIAIDEVDPWKKLEMAAVDGSSSNGYNKNRPDSVPYLIEHARWGEPWAYKALGDCYRYGRGGVRRSMINALTYYGLAERERHFNSWIDSICRMGGTDPLERVIHLVAQLDKKDFDGARRNIEALDSMGYHSADLVRVVLDNIGQSDAVDKMLAEMDVVSTDTDRMILMISALNATGAVMDNVVTKEQLLQWRDKSDWVAVDCLKGLSYIKNELDEDYNEKHAIECFLKADARGALDARCAVELCRLLQKRVEQGDKPFDEKTMERLHRLCETERDF